MRTWLFLFRTGFCVCLAIVTWLALTSSPLPAVLTIWDKADHFTAFATLSFLLDFSFPNPEQGAIRPDWLKWLALFLYGVGIEFVQGGLGTRDFEVADMFADAVGISAYLVARPLALRIPVLAALRNYPGQ